MLDIITGERENREIHGITGVCFEDEAEDESDFEDVESLGFQTDEVHDVLGLASDCVGNLFRISMLIRKATPRDRLAKAIQDRREPFMDQFDINYVQERYPRLARPENTWLLKRLGRAITYRRQYLRYCRVHKERLAQPWSEVTPPPPAVQLLAAQHSSWKAYPASPNWHFMELPCQNLSH